MTKEDVECTPAQRDLELLAYLYDYLEWLSGNPQLKDQSNNFFSLLQSSIGELDSKVRCANPKERESLIGYLRDYLLVVTVKVLKISVTCAICKSVCDKLSLKFRERISLNETVKHVESLQENLLEILSSLNDYNVHKLVSVNGDVDLQMRKYMAHKLVQYLIHDCDEMVTLCEKAVQDKVKSESLFFRCACYSVGALCVGRLLHAVYKNVDLEKMVRTGLWVTCAGLTASVLHIPCMELKQVLDLMEFHNKQCLTMMSMIKTWLKDVPISKVCNGLNSPIMIRTF